MIRPARTHPHTQTTRATQDALAGPAGLLPAGATPRASRTPRKAVRGRFSPVVVRQPAAGRWSCDECTLRGSGGLALLEHFRQYGHRLFTDTDWNRS